MKIAVFENTERFEPLLEKAFPRAEIDYYDHPLTPEIELRRNDYEALTITPNSPITGPVLKMLPGLKLIAPTSTGYDHIDTEACRERGVGVANVPDWASSAVAEYVFALLLGLGRNLEETLRRTRARDFSLQGLLGLELGGKTLGVIGAGSIGRAVLRIGSGFGINLLAHDPSPDPEAAEELGFEYTRLDSLLTRADVISLHLPYLETTRHLIDDRALELVKPGAILINCARGGLVSTGAVLRALEEGRLGGACLDVLEELDGLDLAGSGPRNLGPVVEDLLKRDDVLIAPHAAWATEEATLRVFEVAVENITRFFADNPVNLVG